MHAIYDSGPTFRADFDGDIHFCRNSKFVDILGVKSAEIDKIWKFQKLIALFQKLERGPRHIIHQIASTRQGSSDGVAYFLK
jgi:hypothetical protein